jgi:acyl-CoA thioesterase-1
LQADRDPAWRVVNLSQSGATAQTLVDRQLPALSHLPPPSLVSCAIGINNLLRVDPAQTVYYFELLATLLPPGTLLANMPRGYDPTLSEQLNHLIARHARERGLVLVDLWRHTEPHGRSTLAPDQIHPSDLGYSDWAEAFAEVLGLR